MIKGAVVEDLTLISKSLKDESKRMHPKRLSKLAYSEWVDNVVRVRAEPWYWSLNFGAVDKISLFPLAHSTLHLYPSDSQLQNHS